MNKNVMLGVLCVLSWAGVSYAADAGGGRMERAVAKLEPTKGNVAKGSVTFTQVGDKVRVVADITGLKPNTVHGFHIHEHAECGDDGMAAGGHWNPGNDPHGAPTDAKHHAGDLGNIKSDDKGNAHLEMTLEGVTVNGAKNPVVGHSMMLHADPDDFKTQPTGNSGARIACGPIITALIAK